MALNSQFEKWLKVFIRSRSVVIWPNKKKLQFLLLDELFTHLLLSGYSVYW